MAKLKSKEWRENVGQGTKKAMTRLNVQAKLHKRRRAYKLTKDKLPTTFDENYYRKLYAKYGAKAVREIKQELKEQKERQEREPEWKDDKQNKNDLWKIKRIKTQIKLVEATSK